MEMKLLRNEIHYLKELLKKLAQKRHGPLLTMSSFSSFSFNEPNFGSTYLAKFSNMRATLIRGFSFLCNNWRVCGSIVFMSLQRILMKLHMITKLRMISWSMEVTFYLDIYMKNTKCWYYTTTSRSVLLWCPWSATLAELTCDQAFFFPSPFSPKKPHDQKLL